MNNARALNNIRNNWRRIFWMSKNSFPLSQSVLSKSPHRLKSGECDPFAFCRPDFDFRSGAIITFGCNCSDTQFYFFDEKKWTGKNAREIFSWRKKRRFCWQVHALSRTTSGDVLPSTKTNKMFTTERRRTDVCFAAKPLGSGRRVFLFVFVRRFSGGYVVGVNRVLGGTGTWAFVLICICARVILALRSLHCPVAADLASFNSWETLFSLVARFCRLLTRSLVGHFASDTR